MAERGVPLQPAQRRLPVDGTKTGARMMDGGQPADGEAGEDRSVQPSRQQRQDIEERQRDEQPGERHRRPDSRPDPLPEHRCARQSEQPAEAPVVATGHLTVACNRTSRGSSQSGTRCRPSISAVVGRAATTAKRSPLTSTSAGSGRAL